MQPSYKALLILTVYNETKTEFVSGYLDLALPFSPSSGLLISLKSTSSYKLNHVTWEHEQQQFRCYTEFVADVEFDMDFYISEAKCDGFDRFTQKYNVTD